MLYNRPKVGLKQGAADFFTVQHDAFTRNGSAPLCHGTGWALHSALTQTEL